MKTSLDLHLISVHGVLGSLYSAPKPLWSVGGSYWCVLLAQKCCQRLENVGCWSVGSLLLLPGLLQAHSFCYCYSWHSMTQPRCLAGEFQGVRFKHLSLCQGGCAQRSVPGGSFPFHCLPWAFPLPLQLHFPLPWPVSCVPVLGRKGL